MKDAADRGHLSGNGFYTQKCQTFFEERYGFKKCLLTTSCTDALAIDAYYKDRPLESIGHMGCFSFHDTKGIQCGEEGMLVINDDRFLKRAEIIWEKGTDRAAFFRGEVDKYSWVNLGSSFQPSELTAAFLHAQLENLDSIQSRRLEIWNAYHEKLIPLAEKGLIYIPDIP